MEQTSLSRVTTDEQTVGSTDPNTPLQFITISPRKRHTATVVWLHGLGDTGRGMLRFAKDLSGHQALGHIKWILPHAPRLPVTGSNGLVVNSWFDCYSFDIPNRPEDELGLNLAARHIHDIISVEITDHNIPSSRIIVGGISQGSAVSILTALTTTHRLAGIFILSGYIPLRKKAKEIASPFAQSLPILWAHGRADRQVEYGFSLEAAQTLASDLDMQFRSAHHPLDLDELMMDGGTDGLRFVTYDRLGHWITPEEMKDLSVWINACLPRDKAVMRRFSVQKAIRKSHIVRACINWTRTWFNGTSPQDVGSP